MVFLDVLFWCGGWYNIVSMLLGAVIRVPVWFLDCCYLVVWFVSCWCGLWLIRFRYFPGFLWFGVALGFLV